MMAAPEVLALNSLLIKVGPATNGSDPGLQVSGARLVLDIGVFTGASSLAAALALGEQGRVIALERSKAYGKVASRFWAEAGVEARVELRLGPALASLKGLLGEGRAGTVDFAFIDADKGSYTEYFNICMELLRPGGMVALDNTLFRGHVVKDWCEDKTVRSIQAANRAIAQDPRVHSVLVLAIGDGYTLAVKK
jgi:predicted O-methyltransferase YrrM